MNLISVRDFIKFKKPDDIHVVNEYVMFTDWKVTLGMLVPTDDDGNLIEEPKRKFKQDFTSDSPIGSFLCSYCGFRGALTPTAIVHPCVYDDYQKRKDLLVFKNFVVDDYGDDYVAVTDGFCYLTFHSDGTIIDESDDMDNHIETVFDLMPYELELMYAW